MTSIKYSEKGSLLIILILVTVIASIGIIGVSIFLKQTNSPIIDNLKFFFGTKSSQVVEKKQEPTIKPQKKEWKGVITTNKGFIEINSKGAVFKKDNQVISTLPPGMRIDYLEAFTGYGNSGEDIFKNSIQLLENGDLAFIGSYNVSTALDQNSIYTWRIGSLENPKVLFSLVKDQKINRFTISPDKNQIAIISASVDEKDLYGDTRDIKSVPTAMLLKEFEAKNKKWFEERRVVSIYNLESKQLVKKLQVEVGDDFSRLVWKGNYLFVFSAAKFWIFDLSNYSIIYQGTESGLGQIGDNVVIAPDGSKFINLPEQVVTLLPSKDKGIGFIDFTLVDYNAFSLDSKKMLVQKPKLIAGSNFINGVDKLGEVIFENNSAEIKSLGSFDSLIDLPSLVSREDLKQNSSYREQGFDLSFIVYNPSADFIIFPVIASGDHYILVDLYSLKIGDTKASGNSLTGFDIGTLRDIAFIGWYQSTN